MKIRVHRGSLEEAMKTVREIEPTVKAVIEYLLDMGDEISVAVQVLVVPYGWDERIGWDTFLVTVGGCAVAFTDGPVEMTLESIVSDVAACLGLDTTESMAEPVQYVPAVQPLPIHFVPALLDVVELWRRP